MKIKIKKPFKAFFKEKKAEKYKIQSYLTFHKMKSKPIRYKKILLITKLFSVLLVLINIKSI